MARLSAEALASIISGGLGAGQALLQNRASSNDRRAQLQQLLASITGDELDQDFQRQQAYMGTFGMDPIAQSRHQFTGGVLSDLAARGATRVGPGGVTNAYTPSASTQALISPEARAENAARFYSAAGQLNPSALRPSLENQGYGAAGAAYQPALDQTITAAGDRYTQLNQQRRNELLNAMQEEKKGGGFWNGFKKVLGVAAPIGAMFIPGLQGAGIGALLGRAGVGAGAGALTGGFGGALSGAGMSLASDYFKRPVQFQPPPQQIDPTYPGTDYYGV